MLDSLKNANELVSASDKVNGEVGANEYKVLIGGNDKSKKFYDCRLSPQVKVSEILSGLNAFGHLTYNFLSGSVNRLDMLELLDNWYGQDEKGAKSYEAKNEKSAITYFVAKNDSSFLRKAWREFTSHRQAENAAKGRESRFTEPTLQSLHYACKWLENVNKPKKAKTVTVTKDVSVNVTKTDEITANSDEITVLRTFKDETWRILNDETLTSFQKNMAIVEAYKAIK